MRSQINYFKIGIVEPINDVPSEHEELLSLNEEGVKEAESKEQLFVLGRLRTSIELSVTDLMIQALHIRLQTLPQEFLI